MFPYRLVVKTAILISIFLTFFLRGGFCDQRANLEKVSDVFSHSSILVSSEQVIGKLMVAGGDASIAGKVMDGVIVVDGNLIVESGAMVIGRIIVLGGNVIIEPGGNIEEKPWIIAPQGHPLVPIVIAALFLIAAASLIVLPVLFWLIGHYFKTTLWYRPVKKRILMIEQQWPLLYVTTSLLLSALMLTAFSMLAWETLFRKAMNSFDDSFIWLIRYFANPALDTIMIVISDIGFGTSYIIIVGASFLLLVYLKRWREVGTLAICLAGSALLSFLLKNLFHRARPTAFFVVTETGFSFPSGHALATMCFYGMAAFFIMRGISSWRGRLVVATLAIIMSVAVGVSRIYLGVHYPTDVIAGYAAGSMWLAFCISLLMWWEKAPN